MSRRNLLAACAAVWLSGALALACGPFFPWQLLDDRPATLRAPPANSFAFEAAHLVPPPADDLQANDAPDQPYNPPDPDKARATAEQDGLSAAEVAVLRQVRQTGNGDAAYAAGEELPAAVRLYTAGAVDFHQGDKARAVARFAAVLQLPDAEARPRATWSAYMLGRLRAMAGDVAGASAAFAQTRSLAIGGAPDPLGLAVASYGEEARVHLDRAHGLLKDGGLPEADRHDYADEIEVAVELYAAQAARGSRIAVDSLRMVAEELADPGQPPAATEPAKLRAAIARPIVQRLLVAYALAQGDADLDSNKLLPQLVDAIQDAGGGPPAAADRLAALCYRIGRFDMAAQLAASASGPLAAWVKAKLALQQGDTAAAAADYAEASRAFPDAAASSLDDANIKLIAGERATLALARGGYVDAMAQLYPVAATYWGDVAHIAERVLTVDELKQFVDARVAAPLVPKTKAEPSDDFETWLAPEPAAQLRDLLARRLMREGRFKEAQAYFHAAADPNFDDHDVARQAAQYALALHDSTSRWWQADRARAWYAAAKLARWSGMAMLGYEGPPDYFGLHGDYDTGIGQAKLDGALVTSGEKARFAAAAARPDLRFHYRFIAVDDAIHAADRLPPRSQAFAAVLCQATGWMLSTTDKLDTEDWPRTKQNEADRQVTALYRRYVQQGAYVPWAAHFGHGCPEPDFDAAARFDREQLLRDMRHFASRYRWGLGLGLIGLLGAAIAWLAVRLRAAS